MIRKTDRENEDYESMRNGKVSWWMMGLLAVVIGISLTSWLGWVYGLSDMVHSNTQRIAKVEECTVYIKGSLVALNRKMDRVIHEGRRA